MPIAIRTRNLLPPSEKLICSKCSYWLDFVAFMNERYSEILKLSEVRSFHAEAYIHYIRQNGRFNKTVTYSGSVITKERSYHTMKKLVL